MSEHLSREPETWRADTAAWHPPLIRFTLPFMERAVSGGWWGEGTVSGVSFMLCLLVLWLLTCGFLT